MSRQIHNKSSDDSWDKIEFVYFLELIWIFIEIIFDINLLNVWRIGWTIDIAMIKHYNFLWIFLLSTFWLALPFNDSWKILYQDASVRNIFHFKWKKMCCKCALYCILWVWLSWWKLLFQIFCSSFFKISFFFFFRFFLSLLCISIRIQ